MTNISGISIEERIILAVAELQILSGGDKKISVSAIADKASVSRKTLYSERYKHLLPGNSPSPELQISDDAILQYVKQLQEETNRALKAEKELQKLKSNLGKKKKEFVSNTFSELFLAGDVVQHKSEKTAKELINIRTQLNNKVQSIKALEVEVALLKGKLQDTESSMENGLKGNCHYEYYTPNLITAFAKYRTDGFKGWLSTYVKECKAQVEKITSQSNSWFDGIIIVLHSFNNPKDIELSLNLDNGRYAVLSIAIADNAMRGIVLKPLKSLKTELHVVVTTSTSAVSKWYVRTKKIDIPTDVVGKINETMVPPSISDGFTSILTRIIGGDK